MSTRDPVDLSLSAADPPVTVDHGTGYELLVQLFARAEPADELGPDQAELWLHLVGLALDAREASALIERVARTQPERLAEHLAGLHVPAWRRYVDASEIRSALAGDVAARRRLLAAKGYYAGEARTALGRLFSRPAPETQALVLEALRSRYAEHVAPEEERLAAELAAQALATEAAVRERGAAAAVGYRHTPEPGIARVVLVPQLAASPRLLLLQHDNARVVCYPASASGSPEAALAEACKALGDVQRLGLLRRLAESPATMPELAAELGVPKTSLHHHLSLLRAAGFLAVARRPDRSYAFELRRDAFARVAAEVAARGRSSSR